jgi:type III pantothenate kinase
MLLAIDMGNTNITIGVLKDKSLVMESRLATDHNKMGDQYAVDLNNIFKLYHIDPADIHGAILASVVPPLDHAIKSAVKKAVGITPLQVGPGTKTGLNIRIDNPAQLGADLLVGAVAAAAKYPTPCIIWDLGTATTVSVLDETGAFRGGAILAGVFTAIDSLSNRTSLLPRIRLEAPKNAIGKNTVECMQSGAVYGTAAIIDGMSRRFEQELGTTATIVATGGLGKEIAAHCDHTVLYDEHLLMDGLRILYEKNR